MRNRKTQSALLVAGAAVGAAAAWVGKRRYSDFRELVSKDLIEADGPELPLGRSADPAIDETLQHARGTHDKTSGAALLADPERTPGPARDSFSDIWDATAGFAEGEQTEGYDAVTPEDLGSVWLSRATQTSHDARPHADDLADLPELDDLSVREVPGDEDDDK